MLNGRLQVTIWLTMVTVVRQSLKPFLTELVLKHGARLMTLAFGVVIDRVRWVTVRATDLAAPMPIMRTCTGNFHNGRPGGLILLGCEGANGRCH